MASIFDLFKKIEEEKPAAPVLPVTHIVAGLGNPGEKYCMTRHNCGFMVMDYLSQKMNLKINKSQFGALTAETVISGKRVLLMKPQLLMNRSGEAIRDAAQFYKIPPENILVIFDDISIGPGKLRIKRKGSDGGHNGIKDIIYQLQSDAFPRIKIGTGAPPESGQMISWVLGHFTEDEQKEVFDAIEKAYAAIPEILSGNLDGAMNLYNR